MNTTIDFHKITRIVPSVSSHGIAKERRVFPRENTLEIDPRLILFFFLCSRDVSRISPVLLLSVKSLLLSRKVFNGVNELSASCLFEIFGVLVGTEIVQISFYSANWHK